MKSIWQYLCDQTQHMADHAFAGIETLEDWTRIRPERHREFMQCLGLDPLPKRCDLELTDYGAFSGEGFTGRRVGFRLLPDCWASACIYYPDPLPASGKKLPGVLYVCGHAEIGTYQDQHLPITWARRGYVCLIVDSVEQNDNLGEHHTYAMDKQNASVSLGYNPAGAEVWNAMRALDVLSGDENVDPERLAVTGTSGGGSCSFHMAIVDERIKAVSSACGVNTPRDALINEHMDTQCECMYPYNPYRRDISEYAALIAPRALMLCYADDDLLYHPEETAALAERTSRIYRLYGLEDRCRLVTCPGHHGFHPPFDVATQEFFNTHVAGEREGEKHPRVEMGKWGKPELSEPEVSVFNGAPPAPNRGHLLGELMTTRATVPLPREPDQWPAIRNEALASLPIGLRETAVEHAFQPTGQWRQGNSTIRHHRGQVEGIAVQMYTKSPDQATNVLLSVANVGESHMHAYAQAMDTVDSTATAVVGLMPRVACIPAAGEFGDIPASWCLLPADRRIYRAMLRTGTTPVTMTICDIAATVDYLFDREEMQGRSLFLYGRGDGGAACLYHALLDERVAGVILEKPVRSHDEGAPILGILRSMDIHHAIGLMAPRPVVLVDRPHRNWTWPSRVYKRLGCPQRLVVTQDLHGADLSKWASM